MKYSAGGITPSDFEDLERQVGPREGDSSNENLQASFKKDVYGLFGQIELAGTNYLIVIEEAILEG